MAPGIYKTFRKSVKKIYDELMVFNASYKYLDKNIDDFMEGNKKLFFEDIAKKIENGTVPDTPLYKIYKLAYEDTEKQCYQAMEGFVHNLNTLHSRAGAQVKCCLV